MNDELTAWFHCGNCASLFRSRGGEDEAQRCPACGEDPSVGLDAEASSHPPVQGIGRDPMLRVKMAEVDKPKLQKREVRRYKGRYFVVKLVAAWAVLMVFLAVAGHNMWKEKPREYREEMAATAAKGTLADEDVALVSRVFQKCVRNLSGFLSAGTPEERNQFVRTPVDTARRMARFYQANPFINFDISSISGAGNGVIHLADGRRLLDTRWTTRDGRSFDAVFFDEDGDWRLDWEEFVRYNEQPWALFLAESGDAEGEFRLFARERLADERNDSGSLRISLLAPRFGYPAEAGEPSPEILVDQNTEAAHLLKEALKIRKDGGRIYSSSLPNQDPEGLIRVRVKVRRTNGSLGRMFTIQEVKACHWLSIGDPGVSR